MNSNDVEHSITDLKLLSPESKQRIRELMAKYPKARSAILPALHVVQEQLGWVPEEAQADRRGMLEIETCQFFFISYRCVCAI